MENKKGISYGLLSGIFWGVGISLSSLIFLNYNLSPFLVALIHDFFSIIILAILLIIKYKKFNLKIFYNINSLPIIIAAILAGPIGMQANLYAIKHIGSSLSASITAIYPGIAVVLSIIFLKNKISKNIIIGISLIVISLFIQSYKYEQIENFYLGTMFAFFCALAWGSESILSSYAMKNNLSELEAIFLRQITSFIAYLLIFFIIGNYSFEFQTTGSLKFIVFMAFSNMISYIFYYNAINTLNPAKATGLNVSYVVWASIFSYLILGTQLNINTIWTSLIIILGVYIIIKD